MDDVEWEDVKVGPADGCLIRGLFLEGARYDPAIKALNDSAPKQLYTLLPCMHLMPIKDRPITMSNVYRCPVYKILSRQGVCHAAALCATAVRTSRRVHDVFFSLW